MYTLADVQKVDIKVQQFLDRLGCSSLAARLLRAEYIWRSIVVGDSIKMEQGELSEDLARNLPMTTVLGPDSSLAFTELQQWVADQVKLLSRPQC
jgi:hypothetical protein